MVHVSYRICLIFSISWKTTLIENNMSHNSSTVTIAWISHSFSKFWIWLIYINGNKCVNSIFLDFSQNNKSNVIQQNCACPFLQAWLHWLLNEISWTLEHLALFVQGDYTRTGERKLTGMMKDGVNSANRYFTLRSHYCGPCMMQFLTCLTYGNCRYHLGMLSPFSFIDWIFIFFHWNFNEGKKR